MNCRKCGKELPEGAKFCVECGASQVNNDVETTEVVEDQNVEEIVENNEEVIEDTNEVIEDVLDENEVIEEAKEQDKIWYYVSNNQSLGPCTESEMIDLIQDGTIKSTTYIWKSGLKDWVYLKDSELAGYVVDKKEETDNVEENKDACWFYVNSGNQQTGPFTQDEMIQLIKNGTINGNTYVWKSGMADWIRCKDSTLFYNMGNIPNPNQIYSNGNTDKAYLEIRSIPMAVILSIVTCGLYGFYWLYVLAKDINMLNARQGKPVGTDAGLVVLFTILTCGLYEIYFYWKAGKLLRQLEFNNQYYVEDNSLVMVLLSIFGFGIISSCILQSTLNDIQKYAE